MPDLGNHGDDAVIQYYGCKISTDRGEIVIDYRNSSNGYYGGGLSWPGDSFYGGVHGQNDSNMIWKNLIKEEDKNGSGSKSKRRRFVAFDAED